MDLPFESAESSEPSEFYGNGLNESENDFHHDHDSQSSRNVIWKISITEPERVGTTLYQHMNYQINLMASTKQPNFNKTEYSIIRRYSDFEWLRNRLSETYRGHIIPPIPEKDFVKRFVQELVVYRMNFLKRFLNEVLHSKLFSLSSDLLYFIECSDDEFIPNTNQHKKESKGFLSSLSEKMSGLQVAIGNLEEPDNWFSKQRQLILNLEFQYSGLVDQSADLIRKEMEISEAQKGISEASFDIKRIEKDSDERLSELFSKLSDTTSNITKLDDEVLDAHTQHFDYVLKYFLRYFESVRESFYERDRDIYLHQSSTKSNYSLQEKLKANPQNNKLLEECLKKEKIVTKTQEQVNNSSATLKEELQKFENLKKEELEEGFLNLAKYRIEYHKKAAELWKSILKETIDD